MSTKELLYFLTIINIIAVTGTVMVTKSDRGIIIVMTLISFCCYVVIFVMALGMLARMH